MPHTAATATATVTPTQWATLAGLLLLVLAGYAFACWWWPFTACDRCEAGKIRSPTRKAWRKCRKCKGTGARLRTGRRVFNYLHVTMKEKGS